MQLSAYILLLAFALFGVVRSDGAVNASPAPASPTIDAATAASSYQPQDPRTGYVQPEGYAPYGYNSAAAPVYPAPYPGLDPSLHHISPHSSTAVSPIQESLQIALKFFAKVGLFLAGGVTLLFVGGLFTTAVCSITPLCTIEFPGIGTFGKESLRSFGTLMTPEKLSTAAGIVQEAIGKYQRMQRAVGN